MTGRRWWFNERLHPLPAQTLCAPFFLTKGVCVCETHLLHRAEPRGLWCCSCCLLHMCICQYRLWRHLWSAGSRWASSGTWKKNRISRPSSWTVGRMCHKDGRNMCGVYLYEYSAVKSEKKPITISQIYKKLPSCLTMEKHSKPIKSFSITRCLREAFIEKNLPVKVKKSISWNNCSTTKDQITTNFAVPDWLLEEQILIIYSCQRFVSGATPRREDKGAFAETEQT